MKAEAILAFACLFALLAVFKMCTKLKERHSANSLMGKQSRLPIHPRT